MASSNRPGTTRAWAASVIVGLLVPLVVICSVPVFALGAGTESEATAASEALNSEQLEEAKPVDLALERSEESFSPANPTTPTELPAAAEGPIEVGEGVQIQMPTIDDREAVQVRQMSLFYPEAAAHRPESCPPTPVAARVKLVVAPESVAAGQAVRFRIDNSNGPTLTYGVDYSIQECLAGAWVLASFNPSDGWAKVLIRQRPGHGRWQSVEVPTTAAPGEYRIRKSVAFDERGHSLYGDFDVVAPGT